MDLKNSGWNHLYDINYKKDNEDEDYRILYVKTHVAQEEVYHVDPTPESDVGSVAFQGGDAIEKEDDKKNFFNDDKSCITISITFDEDKEKNNRENMNNDLIDLYNLWK